MTPTRRAARLVLPLLLAVDAADAAGAAGEAVAPEPAPATIAGADAALPCLGPGQARAVLVEDARALRVATPQRPFRIELAQDCPALVAAARVRFDFARGCVAAGDDLHVGAGTCAIAAVTPLPVAGDDAATLARIDVVARAGSGFTAGRTCFDARRVRAWNDRALDRIEVDAGRQGRFELTLANSCPELTSAYSVRFVSQMFGEGSICGNSGDAVEVLSGGSSSLLAQRWGARSREDAGPSGLGPAPWLPAMAGSRCAIAAVARLGD
jgi:hypothetical protein